MRRSGALVSVALMVMGLGMIVFFVPSSFSLTELDTLPSSRHGESDDLGIISGKPWPCCNQCGTCTRSIPPRCTCEDLVLSCHPSCKNCVQSPLMIYPPRYNCRDRIVNFCETRYDSKTLGTE